jgi:hypothetical protein
MTCVPRIFSINTLSLLKSPFPSFVFLPLRISSSPSHFPFSLYKSTFFFLEKMSCSDSSSLSMEMIYSEKTASPLIQSLAARIILWGLFRTAKPRLQAPANEGTPPDFDTLVDCTLSTQHRTRHFSGIILTFLSLYPSIIPGQTRASSSNPAPGISAFISG